MSLNLLEFRKRFPFKPYQRVQYRGGEWEAISFPWPSGDGAGINIRRREDPPTMIEVDASELIPICEHDRSKGCEECGT